jgi:hypothetical protein
MNQTAIRNAEGSLQLGVVAQCRMAAQAGGVQQVSIQLGEQEPAFGKELR